MKFFNPLIFFFSLLTVPILSAFSDLFFAPLGCPNSCFLSVASSPTSLPSQRNLHLLSHSSLYLTDHFTGTLHFWETMCLMTWWLCHSFSFAQWPSSVFAAHVEWMTKPCFITCVEPICGGLFFISSNRTHCPLVYGFVSVPQVSVVRLKVLFVGLKIYTWIWGATEESGLRVFLWFLWLVTSQGLEMWLYTLRNPFKLTYMWLITWKILEGFNRLTNWAQGGVSEFKMNAQILKTKIWTQ